MIITQITVKLENKSGELSRVSDLLGDEGINLRAVTAAVQGGLARIHLVADDPDKAAEVLTGAGFQIEKHGVIAVKTPDHPGGLNAVLRPLKAKGVNVEYLYPVIGRIRDDAVLIIGATPLEAAVDALKGNYITILDKELNAL